MTKYVVFISYNLRGRGSLLYGGVAVYFYTRRCLYSGPFRSGWPNLLRRSYTMPIADVYRAALPECAVSVWRRSTPEIHPFVRRCFLPSITISPCVCLCNDFGGGLLVFLFRVCRFLNHSCTCPARMRQNSRVWFLARGSPISSTARARNV